MYLSSAVVLLVELCKLVFCVFMVFVEAKFRRVAPRGGGGVAGATRAPGEVADTRVRLAQSVRLCDVSSRRDRR